MIKNPNCNVIWIGQVGRSDGYVMRVAKNKKNFQTVNIENITSGI